MFKVMFIIFILLYINGLWRCLDEDEERRWRK